MRVYQKPLEDQLSSRLFTFVFMNTVADGELIVESCVKTRHQDFTFRNTHGDKCAMYLSMSTCSSTTFKTPTL